MDNRITAQKETENEIIQFSMQVLDQDTTPVILIYVTTYNKLTGESKKEKLYREEFDIVNL